MIIFIAIRISNKRADLFTGVGFMGSIGPDGDDWRVFGGPPTEASGRVVSSDV